MARPRKSPPASRVPAAQVEEVVALTRLAGAWIAGSLATAEPALTTAQWRVLVLADRGNGNVSEVADDLGIHLSSASRVCDKLVEAGLLQRTRAEDDRRHVLLHLTERGKRVFDEAMDFRRRRIESAMALMDPADRSDLARVVPLFRQAAEQARLSARADLD